MAERGSGVNVSATVRNDQKTHPTVSASDALKAVRKTCPGQKINEGTFKLTIRPHHYPASAPPQ